MSEAILPDIIVGVDTHKQTHAAVAITRLGARVGELTIEVSLGGEPPRLGRRLGSLSHAARAGASS